MNFIFSFAQALHKVLINYIYLMNSAKTATTLADLAQVKFSLTGFRSCLETFKSNEYSASREEYIFIN